MDKRNLYFRHSDYSLTLVAKNITQEEVFPEIKRFIATLNPDYKIYYIRSWGDEPTTYDVGSHTEFFYWAGSEIALH